MLCGGRSSRMGRAKAWLPFGDELLLPRVVRVLCTVVHPVVVVAAPDQEVPELPAGIEVVRDAAVGHGPLRGLAAGLDALAGKVDAAYLSACDAPFLRAAFVKRVVDALDEPTPESDRRWVAAVPRIDGFFHPLAAAFRLPVRADVAALLDAGERRMSALFGVVPTRHLGPADFAAVDPSLQSLRNLNAPAEYEAALRELG